MHTHNLTWAVVAVTLLSAWLAAVPVAVAADWVELGPAPITSGPWTGRTAAVVASPTNPDKWYVGAASGGVWRTLDGGVNWTPLTDQLPSSSIGALAVDPNNDNVVYAGTGEANFANHCLYGLGVYKSTDGGDTWTILAGDVFGGRTFSRLQIAPGDGQTLFAAISHAGGFYPTRNAAKNHPGADGPVGIFRSTDGGVNWTHLTTGLPATPASDVVIDPVTPTTIYAALGDVFGRAENGLYKSVDNGDTWVELTTGLPATEVGRISLAIGTSDPNRLYAIYTRPSDDTGGGASTRNVYRSDDAGANWTATNPANFQATYGWYLSTAIVDPLDEDVVFVGGLDLLRSTNGGTSWSNVTPGHVDLHGLAYDASHRLISAHDGGIDVTSDQGATWIARNEGLGIIQHYAGLSLHPTDSTFILAGFQDNGTCRRETGVEWSHRLGGDGGCTSLHPDAPTVMFAESQGTGNLYVSLNGGTSFSLVGGGISGSDRNAFMPPVLQYNPTNYRHVICATHRIWRSLDRGGTWTAISGDLTNGAPAAIRCLAQSASNYRVIYAATNDGKILVSTNAGAGWFNMASGIPGWPRITQELAVDPASESTVYLAVQHFGVDQVRRSENYGGVWTSVDDNLPDVPANCVAAYRTATGLPMVLVGTDRGVYVSHTGLGGWRLLGPNLPKVPVVDLVFDANFNRIVAATLGRGTWQIVIPVFGDADDSGVVDMADFAALQNCYSAPVGDPGYVTPSDTCRDLFDIEMDADVDAADYTAWLQRFTGPA